VAIDELDIAADGFVEQFQDSPSRMLCRHHFQYGGEVFDQFEVHRRPFR
jgi:hypothetical protein